MSLERLVTTQPVVETEKLTLRPLRRSDMGMIEHYASDPRVARMTPTIPHPLPPGATEAFVTRAMQASREEDIWAMDGTAQGGPELMGVISLKRMDRGQSEIGYWVGPPYWNTGLASDAVAALLEANPMHNATLFASVFQDNPASARVLTNCGFDYIGDAESYCVARARQLPTWTYLRKLA